MDITATLSNYLPHIIGGIVLLYFYRVYVNMVTTKNKALEALSGIDVQLQKRADLIPNILKIAKKFMEHEVELFSEVTRLRERMTKDYDKTDPIAVKEHLATSQALAGQMNGFMLKAENYPELKSSEAMMNAQNSYNEIEAQISAARRFYNSAATSLRNQVEIFPSSLVAAIVRIKAMPNFEAEEYAKKVVDAGDILNS